MGSSLIITLILVNITDCTLIILEQSDEETPPFEVDLNIKLRFNQPSKIVSYGGALCK